MTDDRPSKDTDGLISFMTPKCSDEVFRYLLRRVPAAAAKELRHEIRARLARRKNIIAIENTRAYIFGIAANVIYDYYRRREVERKRLLIAESLSQQSSELSDTPFDILARQQRNARIRQALKLLPRTHAAVIYLTKGEGLTHEEVAQRLKISIHKVQRYLHEAKGRMQVLLRRLLEKDDYESGI